MFSKDKVKKANKQEDIGQILDDIFPKTGTWNKYSKQAKIGETIWSIVYKAKNENGDDIAIKVLKKQMLKQKMLENLKRQIKILNQLKL